VRRRRGSLEGSGASAGLRKSVAENQQEPNHQEEERSIDEHGPTSPGKYVT
jgi:hypothetical protein